MLVLRHHIGNVLHIKGRDALITKNKCMILQLPQILNALLKHTELKVYIYIFVPEGKKICYYKTVIDKDGKARWIKPRGHCDITTFGGVKLSGMIIYIYDNY